MSKKTLQNFILAFTIATFFQSHTANAQPKHGLITSSPCPFSCRDANIPPQFCRSWQEGRICKVEDLRFPAGHQTHFPHGHKLVRKPLYIPKPPHEQNRPIDNFRPHHLKGLITSGPCPLSCHDLRVPPQSCRSWREKNRCFVEDLRHPAGHRTLITRH